MTALGVYGNKNGSVENCCGEKPSKLKEPEFYLVPAVLNPAPFWSATAVVEMKLTDRSLDDYKGKYLIMIFYQYDFTFFCPTEIIQFNDRVGEFHKLGCEVIAISTDSHYSHLAWVLTPRKQGGLGETRIAMISDKNHEISKAYGILNEKEGIPTKTLFVIDKSQLIRYMSISEPCLARSVDEILRIVEGCIFVDQYGNSCPSGPRERKYVSEAGSQLFGTK